MEEPTYYAVIPAEIRYSEIISSGAKLLWGEIASLCNKRGYCWATNSYFAELYKIDIRTVTRWIEELISCGYIKSETDKKNGNRRKIEIAHGKTFKTARQNGLEDTTEMSSAIDENVLHNNKDNNISNNQIVESEFNLEKEINILSTSSSRHISLIGEYLKEKRVDLRSREQLSRAIARHAKAARALADFSDEQIGKATEIAQKEVPNYTLETLLKILTR